MGAVDLVVRSRLASMVLRRRTARSDGRATAPRFIGTDVYRLGDAVLGRLRVILQSNGCTRPTCTMCPLPNVALDYAKHRVSAEDYVKQASEALRWSAGHGIVSIYNDGSFFADQELPAEARREIYRLVKLKGCQHLMVESLPEFVDRSKLAEAKAVLGDVNLVVGIGLQSANDVVRELCINSPVKVADFLNVHNLLGEFGFGTKAYVMLKAPFLSEDEAVEDACSTVAWLSGHHVTDITICPLRVAPGTLVHGMLEEGLYIPPALTTVAEVLLRAQGQGCHARVSVFNVHSVDFAARASWGCAVCETRLLEGIAAYNDDPSSVDLEPLLCSHCRGKVRAAEVIASLGDRLEERVESYLGRFGIPQ